MIPSVLHAAHTRHPADRVPHQQRVSADTPSAVGRSDHAFRSNLGETAAERALRQATEALDRDLGLVVAAHTELAPVSPGTTELALLEEAIVGLQEAQDALSRAKSALSPDREPGFAHRLVENALARHTSARHALDLAKDMMSSHGQLAPEETRALNLLLLQAVTGSVTEDLLAKASDALAGAH
ncbi:MAG: hypothetical protein VKO21_09395 [Candidatus Sericytochromatia bacterium]|nr:hypothetical protein [Candidatus Sericytochromatia bacterium]